MVVPWGIAYKESIGSAILLPGMTGRNSSPLVTNAAS